MEGFKPIYSKNSRVLILGSFPSVVSREVCFYYGNSRNRFWRVMKQIFNVKLNSVLDKTNFILKNNFALWDICKACNIVGSLDINIKDVEFADLKQVLKPNTNVEKILCNGQKSFSLTQKYLKQNNINIKVVCMPSTSPANTKFDIKLWAKELLG